MSDDIRNREAWLTDFVSMLLPIIRERTGKSLGEKSIKISVGFPSRGGTKTKNRTIGQCWHHGTERKYHQIFIHPELIDHREIGQTIAHELLHAVLEPGTGHRKPFSQAAKAMGLLPPGAKPTATWADEELSERLLEIAEQLGEYPHESLSGLGGPKRKNPLLKVGCPLCGYLVRVTTKWMDEAGAPVCPQCLISMEEMEAGEGIEMATPLYAVDQTIEYRVRPVKQREPEEETPEQKKVREMHNAQQFDPRWALRMNRRGRHLTWFVIDYGPSIIDGMAVLAAPINPATLGEDQYPEWGEGPSEEPLTPVFVPRLTPAESREDAIDLLERLRLSDDPAEVYAELGLNDDQDEADDDDPFFEDEHSESLDDEPYTEEELALYEESERQREQIPPQVLVQAEKTLTQRIKELERLS